MKISGGGAGRGGTRRSRRSDKEEKEQEEAGGVFTIGIAGAQMKNAPSSGFKMIPIIRLQCPGAQGLTMSA